MSQRPLRVLMSFPQPRSTTNPYATLLMRAVDSTGTAQALPFAWSRAFRGDFDVFHVHWPELLGRGRTRPRTLAKQARAMAFLGLLRARGIPVVRTAHNVAPHERGSSTEALLLSTIDRMTAVWIVMNAQTPTPPGAAVELIVHGDYRQWYDLDAVPSPIAGQIGFFGRIRPYKGIDQLIGAYRARGDADRHLTLRIAGAVEGQLERGQVEQLAGGDPGISLHLQFVSDPELIDLVGTSQLIALPYAAMHNSGAALAALSLGRPVLVPDNEVTRSLADEVGQDWVIRYAGALTAADLTAAVRRAATAIATGAPDLSHRHWDVLGAQHVAAYRRALDLKQRI